MVAVPSLSFLILVHRLISPAALKWPHKRVKNETEWQFEENAFGAIFSPSEDEFWKALLANQFWCATCEQSVTRSRSLCYSQCCGFIYVGQKGQSCKKMLPRDRFQGEHIQGWVKAKAKVVKIELKLSEISWLAVHWLAKLPGSAWAGILKQGAILLHYPVHQTLSVTFSVE